MKKIIVFLLMVFMLFQMTVYAAHSFVDVYEDDWYNDAVDYVYENGLMSGTAADRFSPNANMSRAMLVTVLYSLDGKQDVSATNPFIDVVDSDYFYTPVVWAYQNGIVAGTSANTFSPNNDITREQMVAIFAKYAAYKGLDTPASASLNDYSDRNDISGYAMDAFKWAVDAGIVSGTTATTLSPQGEATRAQCAVIMRQFELWMAEQGAGDVLPTPTPPLDDDIENGMGWA